MLQSILVKNSFAKVHTVERVDNQSAPVAFLYELASVTSRANRVSIRPMSHTRVISNWRLAPLHRHRLLVLIGILASFALRLFQLGAASLWYDETVSVSLAKRSIPALIAHTAGDIHPPGYYLLLHAWRTLAQPTLGSGFEFLYAWPSVSCGMLVAPLLYILARRLYNPPVALLSLWLAALHPFQIWYSQEVRMYTLGAMLGLLALWGLLQFFTVQRSGQWLLVYTIAVALGLYTLYYFLFVWAALNLLALLHLSRRTTRSHLWQWLGAQLGVLVLWSPWWPIFWRQFVDPPVPSWRPAWQGWQDLLQAIGESLSALFIGQNAPANVTWLRMLLAIIAAGLIWYVNWRPPQVTEKAQSQSNRQINLAPLQPPAPLILSIYVFTPLLLIYGASLAVTPLYHVRYLFIYAPPFVILVSAALWILRSQRWVASVALLAGLLLLDGWSLQQLWWNPANQRDDHRAAVAFLADQWRPGDRILVNAGWVYTALETYWPTGFHDPFAATPPALAPAIRLLDLAPVDHEGNQQLQPHANSPQLVRTGSVDGPASLGWGAPTADFFAIGEVDAYAALATLAHDARRIWHYRMYDTVSDPKGLLRSWLATHATLRSEWPIAGRDFGLLQLYEVTSTADNPVTQANNMPRGELFDNTVQLTGAAIPATTQAGAYLYITTRWQIASGGAEQEDGLSLSLRLYDEQGNLLAQRDEGNAIVATNWQPDAQYDIALALPVPVATPPGPYTLSLVVYSAQTGQPLPITLQGQNSNKDTQSTTLATLNILPPPGQIPALGGSLARFDYIDLLDAQPAQTTVQASAGRESVVAIKLIWRPRESAYTDTYIAALDLRTSNDEVVQSWEDVLGGWSYPSSEWPAGLPVLDQRNLVLAPSVPAGNYKLVLRVMRHSDLQLIRASRFGWLWPETALALGEVTVTNP